MRYQIVDGNITESFSIDAPYDSKQDAEYRLLQLFLEANRSDILEDLTRIVLDLKAQISDNPEWYADFGTDEPYIDVRLCIDLKGSLDKATWIIRTGLSDYDPYFSEYCSAASVSLDTDAPTLLEALFQGLD